jgi:DNA repair exonuclease SbcCD nuclease subunit
MHTFLNNKICCISDVHVGVHRNSQAWHDLAMDWARWLAAELEKKKISDIVISGDFFHYRSEIAVNTLHAASEMLDIWKNFNILILVGNHDAFFKNSASVNSLSILRGKNNITIIDEVTTIKFGDKLLTFCPWGTDTSQIPKSDIVFGHFSIETFNETQWKTCDHGLRASDLLSKSNLIITGHFHIRQQRNYKKGTILYLGNPYEMNFNDIDNDKGYYILDIITKEFDFYKNPISPLHKKVRLSELVKEERITKNVKDTIANNIIKLIIDKPISGQETDILISKLSQLEPLSINLDYEINFDSYQFIENEKCDLSNVDMEQALLDFICLLEIPEVQKIDVEKYSLDIFDKCK